MFICVFSSSNQLFYLIKLLHPYHSTIITLSIRRLYLRTAVCCFPLSRDWETRVKVTKNGDCCSSTSLRRLLEWIEVDSEYHCIQLPPIKWVPNTSFLVLEWLRPLRPVRLFTSFIALKRANNKMWRAQSKLCTCHIFLKIHCIVKWCF